MTEPTPPRDSRRIPIELRVQLKYDRFSGFISEMSANLSPGGMFIQSDRPEPVGSLLDFELRLGDGFELLRGRGLVAWVRSVDDGEGRPPGMGVRFLGLTQQGRELIQKVVAQHVSRGGTPFDLTQVGASVAAASSAPLPSPRVASNVPNPALPPEVRRLEPTGALLDATLPLPTARAYFPELAATPPADVEAFVPRMDPPPVAEPSSDFEVRPKAPAISSAPSAPPIRSAESAMSLFPEEVASSRPQPRTVPRTEVVEPDEAPPLFGSPPPPFEVDIPPSAPVPSTFAPEPIAARASGILDPETEVARGPAPYFSAAPAPPPRRLLPRFSLVLVLVVGISAFAAWWLRDLWWDLVFDSVGAEPLPAAFAQPERSPTRRPLSAATPARGGATTAATPVAAHGGSSTAGGAASLPSGTAQSSAAPSTQPTAIESSPTASTASSAAPLPILNVLERIEVRPLAGETVVTLVADGILRSSNYARFRIDSGSPRELVKLRGVRRPYPTAVIAVGSPELTQIRTGFHAPEELHVVFDLASSDIEIRGIEESAASLVIHFGRRAR